MKNNLFLSFFALVILSCHQDNLKIPEDKGFDKSKFADKDWYWGGKQTPQMLTINFKSNDTATMTTCTYVVPPYRYSTQKWFWQRIGNDSVNLGGFHLRVYSVTDSVLVTSNWVIGGISDTIRQTFSTH